jgi:hypothetical protein
MICLPYYLLCFLFNTIREEEGGTVQPGSEGVGMQGRGVGGTNNVYTSKCKNDKRGKKKKSFSIYEGCKKGWKFWESLE